MKKSDRMNFQTKIFEFALDELVLKHRESFQPLWTVESWVKFLIWIALNCGVSAEIQSIEAFVEAMGEPLTGRMRRLFFARTLDLLSLKVMADPAESQVLVMSTISSASITNEQVSEALDQVKLLDRVVTDQALWKGLDALIAIPWKSSGSEEIVDS